MFFQITLHEILKFYSKLFVQVILLIVSIAVGRAIEKKKTHKRLVQLGGLSGYLEPPEHDRSSRSNDLSPGYNIDDAEWNSKMADWNPDSEPQSLEEDEHSSYKVHEPEEHSWPQEPHQTWHSSNAWRGESHTWMKPHAPSWPSMHSQKPWPNMQPPQVSVKTIVKKIPVPYERPIKIENPIYTPVEKHIPIDRPVPVYKYVEKPVPIHIDRPVPVPIVKEEHVPQPYDQKVKVIYQKVFVHVPSPPHHPGHTIIIRKKLHQRNLPVHKHKFAGFL